MLSSRWISRLVLSLSLAGSLLTLTAQRSANSNAVYRQLRGLLPGGEVIVVKDLEIKRDAATFTFSGGNIAFYGQVNGKVTGAVFRGRGHLHVTPPTAEERHNLSILNKTEEFDEDFDRVVLRFTDATADELRKASTGPGQPDNEFVKAGQDLQSFLRHHAEGSQTEGNYTLYFKKLYGNLDLRLFEDVLSPTPGEYFMAAVHGKKDAHLFFVYDPRGVDEVAPEEVALINWSAIEDTATYPLAFHRAAEYAGGTASGNEHNAAYKILNEDLDVSIEKNGTLAATATVKVRAEKDGLAVIPLDLYPSLGVSQVSSDKGDALDWVREPKDEDPDFGVVLGAPLKKDDTTTFKVAYSGKEVVIDEGSGNYYPVAREDWYPNSSQGLGDYATYDMRFHVPKELQLIATGTKVNDGTEGKVTTTEWKTETPLPVVGFSLGSFEMKKATLSGSHGDNLTIDAYANKFPPDQFKSLLDAIDTTMEPSSNSRFLGAVGTLSTTAMLPQQLNEGRVAAQVYTDYFGQLPFPHIAVTQQSACNYGQSWPMLVYLPICGFLDQTQKNALGLRPNDMYWKTVTAHETAHQWWGQTVGFRGYRDQWMSEGFAHASASIFLQITRPKPEDFLNFWKEERRLLTEKTEFGFRPIDVGPVTMGIRLDSPKTGWSVYQNLVYPKGAFILHMVRMMMWTPKEGDARFKATMQDFVSTYRLQAATTEDFKAIVEKHMSPGMDLEGNRHMDWFFREYVYGTDLPVYHFEGDAKPSGDGWSLHFKLIQSGVKDDFVNAVPVYLELTDGKVLRMGSVVIHGTRTVEQTVQLPKLPASIKKVAINYYYDVLSTEN